MVTRFSSYFNPRSPRGERLDGRDTETETVISIHAPRVGSDGTRGMLWLDGDISIHAPRVGSDDCVVPAPVWSRTFQSTLPAWGATFLPERESTLRPYFNPRSPRGERLEHILPQLADAEFQSTLPAWGATSLL